MGVGTVNYVEEGVFNDDDAAVPQLLGTCPGNSSTVDFWSSVRERGC